MKDMYSFHLGDDDMDTYYETVKDAYTRIFKRCGIGDNTYVTYALGGSFSKYSHEFQTVTDAGEDLIYIDTKKNIAINKEALNDEVLTELGVERETLVEKKAVEVGNIFKLKIKYSAPFELTYKDEKGELHDVIMGCYGIGLGRLLGTITEVCSDAKGLVWPAEIAPFRIHLITIGSSDIVRAEAKNMYTTLQEKGISVLWDDRDVRPGEKFADSELLGLPVSIVISEKTLEAGTLEVKERATGKVSQLSFDDVLSAYQ